jgi:hypothetical protein
MIRFKSSHPRHVLWFRAILFAWRVPDTRQRESQLPSKESPPRRSLTGKTRACVLERLFLQKRTKDVLHAL